MIFCVQEWTLLTQKRNKTMSSLGELFFSLGLDSQKFDDAIKEAKKKVAELTGEASITINADASKVAEQVRDGIKEVTGEKAKVSLEVDKKGKASIEELVEDIRKARVELERLKTSEAWNTSAISRQEGFIGSLERQLEVARATKEASIEASKAVREAMQPNQTIQHVIREEDIERVDRLTAAWERQNEQLEIRNRLDQGKIEAAEKNKAEREEKARLKAEEKAAKDAARSAERAEREAEREEAALLRRLDKEAKAIQKQQLAEQKIIDGRKKLQEEEYNRTRWARKQELANSSIYESAEYKREQNLLRDYFLQQDRDAKEAASLSSKWMDEARKRNSEIKAENIASSKLQAANASASNNELRKQLRELQRLEEAIRRLQYLRVDLDTSDVDKDSKAYKEAAAELDAYIDKLQKMQGAGMKLSSNKVTDAVGADMTNVVNRVKKAIKDKGWIDTGDLDDELDKTKNKIASLGQLMSNVFNYYMIERFVRNLYIIGGEFQKQQIALQSMIGDMDKANAIFERTKQMAVKSPFTFSELASYTKQMSAYGIEYENLYDTTKRLADISAGVGVDMGRLILAFGQVRSAAVLRGQELRQFTEAGIPLVNELAKKFTELENKAVSAGEVFDKISRREVSFGMVRDILFDMTDPGGRFYEMQEELSKSLAGQWSNLKDSWEIMIAEIADSTNGPLNGLVSVMRSVVENWRLWLPLISGAAAGITVLNAGLRITAALAEAQLITQGALAAINPWIAGVAAIGALAAAGIAFASSMETAEEALNRQRAEMETSLTELSENEKTAERYLDILSKTADKEADKDALVRRQKATLEVLRSMYGDIVKDVQLEELTTEKIFEWRQKIGELTGEETKSLLQKNVEDSLKAFNDAQAELTKRKTQKKTSYVPGVRGELTIVLSDYSQAEINEATSNVLKFEDLYNKALERQQEYLNNQKKLSEEDLTGWREKAKELIKGTTIQAPKEDQSMKEYFNYLKEEYDTGKSEFEMYAEDNPITAANKKTAKALRDAANKVNIGLGGISFVKKDKDGEDAAKRDAKAYLDTLKDGLRLIGYQWDLYKELFDATGDKNLSMKIAFDGQIPAFDSYIEHLKGKMEEEINKRGLGISVSDLLEMGKEGIADKVNDKTATAWTEETAKNLNTLIDEYNKANEKLRKESVDTFIDIIKNSKDFAQQIADVERQLQKELKVLEETYGTDSEEYNRRSKEAINRAEEKISSINLEKFKKESNWVNVFSNLENVPLDVIDDMIKKIEDLKAEFTDMKFNELKELAEALKRLRAEILDRNPFKLIGDSISNLKKNINDKESWNDLGKGLEAAVQVISTMTNHVTETMEVMGVTVTEEAKKLLNGLENLGTGLAHAFEGYATDDYLKMATGLIEAAKGMSKIVTSLFENNADKEAHRQYLLDIIRLQTEYNSALIDTKLLNEDVWGNTKIQDSINAVEALSQAVKYYNELVEKEVEAHQDPTGGFWKRFGAANIWNPLGWWSLTFDDLTNYFKEEQGLVKIKDNLRYITQTPNMFRHTKTTNLVDWLKEEGWGDLFDKDGRLNLDLATSIKDWDRLTGETKEYLNNLIEAEEAIRKSEEALDDYLSETFGDLGNQLSDSIVDAFRNGTDAAEGFKDSVVAVLEDVGAQIMRNVFLTEVFSEYEKDLKQIYGDYAEHQDKKKFTEDLSSATKDFVDDTKDSIEAGTSWLEQYKKLMKEQGFDVYVPEESESSLSKGVQSITEDTADILASYVNAMRADVSVNRTLFEQLVNESVPRMSMLAEAQLTQLRMVADNTRRNADAADRIYELVNRVVDRGSGKLKVG